jgi:hypothetical protein
LTLNSTMTKKLSHSAHSHKRAKASQAASRRHGCLKELTPEITNTLLSPLTPNDSSKTTMMNDQSSNSLLDSTMDQTQETLNYSYLQVDSSFHQ